MLKKCTWVIFACLVLYLGLYTWNWKTHYLDRVAAHSGLEAAGWILKPGDYILDKVGTLWKRYVYLVDVRRENERLQKRLDRLQNAQHELRAKAEEAARLQGLLDFEPPPGWESQGARIVGHKMGLTGVLETVIVDKGGRDGVSRDQPVVCPEGVVGRIYKVSPNFSQVLLLSDPNSRLPVISSTHRVQAIATGQGPDSPLNVDYVPLNAPLDNEETLLTSGLAGVFPKGYPVAEVSGIQVSEVSLFQVVRAEPLVRIRSLEEVVILSNPANIEKRNLLDSGG
ncbi:MAG: rod shape-determining protein MreC [Desulfonatronovibrionaceae bacterium]